MKTCTWLDILNQAAEFAARTRDKIPVQEQVSLQGFLATEFEKLLPKQLWPELIPGFFNAPVADQVFSKNEGSVNPLCPELGQILVVLTHDPHRHECWDFIDWSEGADANGNGQVYVQSCRTSVYVEYMLPYPGVTFPDLAGLTQANFWAARCPRRFREILAHKAAAHLYGSDGPAGAGPAGVQFGLANDALTDAVNALPAMPAWRGVRMGGPRWEGRRPQAAACW